MKLQPGYPVVVTGTGSFLPGDPIPADKILEVLGDFDQVDDDFKKWHKRSRKMMRELLGMEYYYYALDPATGKATETPSSMAAKAARKALEAAQLEPNDIDLVLFAGASFDRIACPPTSAFVQEHLGIKRCAEMSIHSNCTSTYKAMQIAADGIAIGRYKNVLLTTTNQISRMFHISSYNQAKVTRHQAMIRWFLCDGSGAMVIRRDDGTMPGLKLQHTFLESVGLAHEPHMYTRYGAPHSVYEAAEEGLMHLTQNFQQVSQIGPKFFFDGVVRFCEQIGFDTNDMDKIFNMMKYFLANVPADHLVDVGMDEVKQRWGWQMAQLKRVLYSTVQERGYTGPAAIAITLDELIRKNLLANDDVVASFVTESSKWMNAGFLMQYRA